MTEGYYSDSWPQTNKMHLTDCFCREMLLISKVPKEIKTVCISSKEPCEATVSG